MTKTNFEEQLAKLEQIVANLESGTLTLDDSLEQYKQGIGIIKNCNSIIETAQKEVEKLSKELK